MSGYDPSLFERIAEAEPRSFWFRARNRLVADLLRKHFPDAESLLEVGCGTGVVLEHLRRELPGLRLVGSDLFAEGLEVARRRLPDVELVRLDARELPYDAEFDVVAALDVLEHVDDEDAALSGLHRAAKPGGGAIVIVPQHPRLWSDLDEIVRHERRYTRRRLVDKVRSAGFEVEVVSSWVTTLLPAALLSRLVRRGGYDPVAELVPPRPLNAVFERVVDAERKLIGRGVSLPFGTSLLVVARKP